MNSDSKLSEDRRYLESALEAILISSAEPVATEDMAKVLELPGKHILECLKVLQDHYEVHHGFRLVRLGGGWQFASAPEEAEKVARFRESCGEQPLRLSRAALESLAVIAYKQPVTRGEIEEIRGVRSEKVVETLLRLGLIRVAGRRKGTGTPLLFRTTSSFLDSFNLESISDLPSLEDLQDVNIEEAQGDMDP